MRRALRPSIDLKEAVERRSPDEVRPLVLSLNRLFDLVNARAESQRRFLADAAHQLRTPLAGLQSQVEAWAQALGATAAQANPDHVYSENSHLALAVGQPVAGPRTGRCTPHATSGCYMK